MMTNRTRSRIDTLILFVAPVVFLSGLVAHPIVRTYLDTEVVAEAVSEAPGRWALAHMVIAVGIGLVLLAALAIRRQFRIAGEERWSVIGIASLAVSGALLGAVVGSEITLSAVVNSGFDVVAVLIEGEKWTRPLFLGAIVLFMLGWLSFGAAFRRKPILPPARDRLAIIAVIAIPVGSFIPQTTGTYIYGGAVLIVSWTVGLGTALRESSRVGAADHQGSAGRL